MSNRSPSKVAAMRAHIELTALRERAAQLEKERDEALLGVGAAHENWRAEKHRADNLVKAIAAWLEDAGTDESVGYASDLLSGAWQEGIAQPGSKR